MAKQLSTRNSALVFFQWPWRKIGRFRLLLCLILVSTAMWIAFAKLVVPRIIASAYHGESLPPVNNMIKGQHVNPINYYLDKWDALAMAYLVHGLEIWLLILLVSSPTFHRVFRTSVREAKAKSLSEGVAPSEEVVRSIPALPLGAKRDAFNLFSLLALVLICGPLTIGAIWAFPIWDDAWVWLILNENSTGILGTAWGDRPESGRRDSITIRAPSSPNYGFTYSSHKPDSASPPFLGCSHSPFGLHCGKCDIYRSVVRDQRTTTDVSFGCSTRTVRCLEKGNYRCRSCITGAQLGSATGL